MYIYIYKYVSIKSDLKKQLYKSCDALHITLMTHRNRSNFQKESQTVQFNDKS